jgi:mannitol/fructose-specific phosphotransferase system IIA component (Ntr-type)
VRHGAIYHWFARLGQRRYNGLDKELWQIMREKGLRAEDPFDELVTRAEVIDLDDQDRSYRDVVQQVSSILAPRLSATSDELVTGFIQEARIGWTPVSKGVTLPSLLLFRLQQAELVVVRSKRGITVDVMDVHGDHSADDPIHAFFFLVSPEEDPKQHLRFLAELAERTDEEDFMPSWRAAPDAMALKEALLHDDKYLSLKLASGGQTQRLINKPLRSVPLPDDTLVALIRRDHHTIVPRGDTVFRENDQLIVIGEPAGINELVEQYSDTRNGTANRNGNYSSAEK